MSKTILLIDTQDLCTRHQTVSPGSYIRSLSDLEIVLKNDGKWEIRKYNLARVSSNYPKHAPPNPTTGQMHIEKGVSWIWDGHWTADYITQSAFDCLGADADFMEVIGCLAEYTKIDLQDPRAIAPICTCPTECDCQDYENGNVSNECPVHNDNPQPAIDCPQHGWSL